MPVRTLLISEWAVFSLYVAFAVTCLLFSLPRLCSSCSNEHTAPLEHEPFDDHCLQSFVFSVTLVSHCCDWDCAVFHLAFFFLSFERVRPSHSISSNSSALCGELDRNDRMRVDFSNCRWQTPSKRSGVLTTSAHQSSPCSASIAFLMQVDCPHVEWFRSVGAILAPLAPVHHLRATSLLVQVRPTPRTTALLLL